MQPNNPSHTPLRGLPITGDNLYFNFEEISSSTVWLCQKGYTSISLFDAILWTGHGNKEKMVKIICQGFQLEQWKVNGVQNKIVEIE